MITVTMWGTRGSLPDPGAHSVRYGGNTSCVTLEVPGEPLVVVDAGTGIANLARALGRIPGFTCTVLLSHLHWDHVIGLPFFFTADAPDAHVQVWGPRGSRGLRHDVDAVIGPPGFPINASALQGRWEFHDITDEDFDVGSLRVRSRRIRHRGPTLGFRIDGHGGSLAYISDHGPGAEGRGPEHDDIVPAEVLELVRDVDVLVHDSQHTPEQYERFRHFGHCTPAYAVKVAKAGAARELVLFHHDPGRDDDGVDMMVRLAREAAVEEGYGGVVRAAMEGETFLVGGGTA
jgi:phosphoribosyl 1,2-cyclic phosphodiesterase